jgi:hypothetical protein
MRPVRYPVIGWVAVVLMLSVGVAATVAQESKPSSARQPRTPWGDPDLQGTWDYWTFTPLERPAEYAGRETLTADEARDLAKKLHQGAVSDRQVAGDPGAYSQEVWTDRGFKLTALTQTSIIVDPRDGKIPPLTPEGARKAEAHKAAGGHPVRIRTGGIGTDDPEDRGVAERCLLGFSTGPPMLPGGYNNNVQIIQSPGYVVILLEMNHDARIIPLGKGPHLPSDMRQWLGDSRGHWDGNTLVVETTNFTDKTASIALTGFAVGSAENLKLTERFKRIDGDTLQYEFTVDDPSTFTRPFTGRLPMNLTDGLIYEYACHEGNYGLINMLSGARLTERTAAAPR